MNFAQWYTDTVDVYRITSAKVGSLTKNSRTQIYAAIPCRIYQDAPSNPRMSQDAASIDQSASLALSNDYDIKAGDELIVYRGGGLGHTESARYFAGDPHHHYEPFGAVMPQLAHQEIKLLQQERL